MTLRYGDHGTGPRGTGSGRCNVFRIALAAGVGLVLTAGCSSSTDEAAPSTGTAAPIVESTAPATTPAPTTPSTTEAPTTTTQAPTTTAALARDTEVAVRRCTDSWTLLGLYLSAGSFDEADESSAACDEAQTQLDVDDTTVARQIAVIIAEAGLDISFARVKTFEPEGFTTDDAAALDTENRERALAIDELIP